MAMIFHRSLIIAATLLFLFGLFVPFSIFARELVLVTSTANNLKSLSMFEIRKIFLGYQVERDGQMVYAIRNKSDDAAYQIFLQKLVHMSENNYERRLLSKTFRTGTHGVSAIKSFTSLKKVLLAEPSHLSIIWRADLESGDGLKVIQSVWQDIK